MAPFATDISKGERFLRKLSFSLAALLTLPMPATAETWTGKASYYALKGRTASGAHVGGHAGGHTAAHPSLPFGSKALVTNLGNQRAVIVTINDRGPFTGGRVIDVSRSAADALGFRKAGVAQVKVEAIEAMR
jgi:rare lipoprotein A